MAWHERKIGSEFGDAAYTGPSSFEGYRASSAPSELTQTTQVAAPTVVPTLDIMAQSGMKADGAKPADATAPSPAAFNAKPVEAMMNTKEPDRITREAFTGSTDAKSVKQDVDAVAATAEAAKVELAKLDPKNAPKGAEGGPAATPEPSGRTSVASFAAKSGVGAAVGVAVDMAVPGIGMPVAAAAAAATTVFQAFRGDNGAGQGTLVTFNKGSQYSGPVLSGREARRSESVYKTSEASPVDVMASQAARPGYAPVMDAMRDRMNKGIPGVRDINIGDVKTAEDSLSGITAFRGKSVEGLIGQANKLGARCDEIKDTLRVRDQKGVLADGAALDKLKPDEQFVAAMKDKPLVFGNRI